MENNSTGVTYGDVELRALSARALKNLVTMLGGSTAGLLEKTELVERARELMLNVEATSDVDFDALDPSSTFFPEPRPVTVDVDIEKLSLARARYTAENYDDSLPLRVFLEPLMRHTILSKLNLCSWEGAVALHSFIVLGFISRQEVRMCPPPYTPTQSHTLSLSQSTGQRVVPRQDVPVALLEKPGDIYSKVYVDGRDELAGYARHAARRRAGSSSAPHDEVLRPQLCHGFTQWGR